jgi:hypothetical protein
MKRKLLAALVASLFAVPALAQVTGSVSIGGMRLDDDDAVDASQLHKYRDLDSGLITQFDMMGRGGRWWFDAFAENLGREDMYAALRGGIYDAFKYRVYTDSLKHNFLFNGRTPYAGSGSSRQTATFPRLDVSTWNPIDEVAYKRRDTGGFFELQMLNPWYFRADANQVTTRGTKYGASSQGLSPGNGFVDLIFPVDYTTKNSVFEAGYNGKTIHGSLSWMASKFENDNEFVDWTNGFFANGLDRSYLGAGNEYSRLSGNLTFRKLPFGGTLALRFTKDELESDVNIASSVLHTAGAIAPTGASTGTFQGKVDNTTFSAALATTPWRGGDLRVYANSHERKDKSTHVTFNSTLATGYENEPFSFDKTSLGVEAAWRIARGHRIAAGYDQTKVEREGRHDFNDTKDKRFFAEYKTSFLDDLAVRLKYTRLERDSNFLLGASGTGTGDAAFLNRYVTAFDLSNVDQDQLKLTADFSPIENLDLSMEAISKRNKFSDNILGRLKDNRREVYLSASYGAPGGVRLTAFVDAERISYDSRHRVGTGTAVGTYDPFAPPTATIYNWEGKVKDRNSAYGLAIDVPVSKRLVFKASAINYKTDGSVDLALQEGVPASVVRPIPIDLWDDTKRTSLTVKGVYELNKAWTITGGYAYEKFEFRDAQVDGYRYTIPAANRADSYLNGLLANPDYTAHIVYAMVTYRF